MSSKYDFERKEIELNNSAQSIVRQFAQSGYTPEHMMGSYLDYKKGVQNSAYPPTDLWKGVKEADFLTCYCAHIAQCKGSDSRLILQNEYGIDNSIVFERFFRSVNSTDYILIINPHPQFVQSLETISAHITITYTDDQYVEMMSTPKSKSNRKCESKVVVAPISQLEKYKYNRALFFTQNLTTSQIVLAMEQLKPLLVDDKDTIIYLQMPSKHLDNKHSHPVLCEVFRKDFTVSQVILLDPAATQGCDKKRCIMILRNVSPSSTADVVLQKMQLVIEKDKQYLSGSETRRIYYAEFLSASKTLRALYDTLGRDTSHVRERESATQFKYSKEIGYVWISSMPKGRNEIRPKYSVYDTPNTDQLRRNKDAHGDKVYVHQGPRMSSREQAMAHALDVMFDVSEVFDKLYNIVVKAHYRQPISIKTLWYIYHEELEHLRHYDNVICEQMFRSAYSAESLIENLIVGESTYAQIETAIKEYCAINKIPEACYEKILAQISVLWDFGVMKMHAKSNPIDDSFVSHKGVNKTQEMRNALVVGSHSEQSTETLITNLMDDTSDSSLRVGCWLIYLLPIFAGDACALCWRDLKKVEGEDFYQLIINKKFGSTGTKSIPLVGRWLARELPVIRMLETILLKHKRAAQKLLMAQGRSDISIEDCPIIHAPEDPTKPVHTRTLNAFARAMLSTLNMPSHLVVVPKQNGKSEMTDINSKSHNFLRSNFEYNMITYAKMNEDEIAYMMGRTPVTVIALHYISRNHSKSKKALFLKMRKWEMHLLGGRKDDTAIYGVLTSNAQIIIPERNELFEVAINIQCNGETPVMLDVVSQFGFRANISTVGGKDNG